MTILITSGAYVSAEMAAEFGRIPSSFVPVGTKRLFNLQVDEIRKRQPTVRVVISLPEDYALGESDELQLRDLDVDVVRVPIGISLGESVSYVFLSAQLFGQPVQILHGDTLLVNFPICSTDCFSAGGTSTFYPWADFTLSDGAARFSLDNRFGTAERSIATGFFSFEDTGLLLSCLAKSGYDFIAALDFYSMQRPLTPVFHPEWFDFGHLHTYYQSRRVAASTRGFNRLESEGHFFKKSSLNAEKILGERAWFKSIPDSLSAYVPQTIIDGELDQYRLEYLYLPTLSEMFVFGELPPSVWQRVFESCGEFLSTARQSTGGGNDAIGLERLYLDKTLSRLETYEAQIAGRVLDVEHRINGIRTPTLRRIVEELSKRIGIVSPSDVSVVHGDFCFSNILFDFRAQRIKVIDPRGIGLDNRPSIFGDRRYELGKLHHSVVGQYDHIVAGRFTLERVETSYELRILDSRFTNSIQELFMSSTFDGLSPSTSKSHEISALLFLSMLPLHNDNYHRQQALFANGLRLWAQLV